MINDDHFNSLSLNLKLLLPILRHECFDVNIMLMIDKFLEENLICDTVVDEIIEKGLFYELDEVKHIEDSRESELLVIYDYAAHLHAEL